MEKSAELGSESVLSPGPPGPRLALLLAWPQTQSSERKSQSLAGKGRKGQNLLRPRSQRVLLLAGVSVLAQNSHESLRF